ncbi:MAG: glycosyltransferase family 4 protein [Planctomycetota bacterium]
MSAPAPERPLRVDLVQPTLAKYRVAPFRELASRPNIDLHVWFASDPDLPNVEADGFATSPSPIRRLKVGPRTISYQPAQWRLAGKSDHPSRDRVLMLLWDVQYATLVPAILRARRNGIATVLWGHGFGKNESPAKQRIRDRVGKLADTVVVYDDWAAERLIERGFDADRVFVARNTIDVADVQQRAASLEANDVTAFRQRIGIGDDPMVLLVSRAMPERRADLLLEAAATLRASEHPDLRVGLVGAGWSDVVASDLTRLGLGAAVIMPGAVYDDAELAFWFAASTAVVLPEEAGLAVVHAMANGRPVVTHDDAAAHAPEGRYVRHDVTGLLFRRGDMSDLARQVGRLLSDPELADRLGKQASVGVTDRLSVSTMIDGHIAAIVAARDRRDQG